MFSHSIFRSEHLLRILSFKLEDSVLLYPSFSPNSFQVAHEFKIVLNSESVNESNLAIF